MATDSLSVHPRGFLTPEDARSFDGYSIANAIAVKTALAERGCACEPYEDVFTFNRWRAQGRIVRRGEHGIRLTVYITAMRAGEDADGVVDEPRAYRMPKTSHVFCRCQTDELAPRERYTARPSRLSERIGGAK
ncbi:MAG TPA: ArdC family protein [Candidatus Limnocylindria bacterium]|jgi:antirestriction protein ArdC|nr:ArdC family protein [Candidatus Limnocylindria bacterium]